MLPFQSRNVRDNHSDEEINTDNVEVVHHVRNAAQKAALMAPSSQRQNFGSTLRSTGASSGTNVRNDRPRSPIPAPLPASRRAPIQAAVEVFSEPEEEMTCLMPSKLVLPPTSKRANELRSMSFRPQPQPQKIQQQRFSPTTPQPMRTMSARQESMHEDAPVNQRMDQRMDQYDSYAPHRVPAAPASLAPMAMPSVDSDPRINPGATVLTSRSLMGRPTASWAAALVVMGIFTGLVTAAVARGDLSDAKVAAASQPAVQQVIPSQAQQPAGSPPSSPMMGAFYNSGSTAPMALSAPISAGASQVVAAQPVAIQQPIMQQPIMQQPVQQPAAPAVAAKFIPAPRAVAPRAAAPAPVAHVAKPEVKEKKEVVAAKPKKEKGDDMASAKEAQALADAQLAASL